MTRRNSQFRCVVVIGLVFCAMAQGILAQNTAGTKCEKIRIPNVAKGPKRAIIEYNRAHPRQRRIDPRKWVEGFTAEGQKLPGLSKKLGPEFYLDCRTLRTPINATDYRRAVKIESRARRLRNLRARNRARTRTNRPPRRATGRNQTRTNTAANNAKTPNQTLTPVHWTQGLDLAVKTDTQTLRTGQQEEVRLVAIAIDGTKVVPLPEEISWSSTDSDILRGAVVNGKFVIEAGNKAGSAQISFWLTKDANKTHTQSISRTIETVPAVSVPPALWIILLAGLLSALALPRPRAKIRKTATSLIYHVGTVKRTDVSWFRVDYLKSLGTFLGRELPSLGRQIVTTINQRIRKGRLQSPAQTQTVKPPRTPPTWKSQKKSPDEDQELTGDD